METDKIKALEQTEALYNLLDALDLKYFFTDAHSFDLGETINSGDGAFDHIRMALKALEANINKLKSLPEFI